MAHQESTSISKIPKRLNLLLLLFVYLLISNTVVQGLTGESQATTTIGAPHWEWSIIGFPVVLYMPETSVILGGGAAVTIRDGDGSLEDRPNCIYGAMIYSFKNQINLNLMPEFYFDDYTWKLNVLNIYQKYTASFYGVGNQNPTDAAEDFTTEDIVFQPTLTHSIFHKLSAGLRYDFKKTTVLEREPDGKLAQDKLNGLHGSLLSGLGPVVEWDSRDNVFCPTRGLWVQLNCDFYRSCLGSEFNNSSYSADVRYYFTPAARHVLAVQLLGKSQSGDITFNEYVKLDGMRGISSDQFRERQMLMTQLEYRYPIYKRLTGAAFVALGDVMHDIREYRMAGLKSSYGFGIRYLLNPEEKINLRLDIGMSRWGISPYFQISEAF